MTFPATTPLSRFKKRFYFIFLDQSRSPSPGRT